MKLFLSSSVKFLLQLLFKKKFLLTRNWRMGIALTFDDGPHPVHTPIILDELSKRNIKAAFFVTGSELKKYPDLGIRIVAEGHLLGNHTFDHLNVHDVSFSEYRKSIEKTENIIREVYGEKYRKLFRPPYSAFSFRLIWYVLMSNYLLFNWNVDSRDSFIKNVNDLAAYISNLELKNGDILLLHEDYRQTAKALPVILDQLLKDGLQFLLPF